MRLISTNKKVLHNYQVIEQYTGGLVLYWYEVKSIKAGQVSIGQAWVRVDTDGKVRLEWLEVPLYAKTSLKQIGRYDSKRSRLVLFTAHEIRKLAERTHKTGNTLKVVSIGVGARWYIKIVVGLVKIMKKIEKKQRLVEKQTDRQAQIEMKNIIFTS